MRRARSSVGGVVCAACGVGGIGRSVWCWPCLFRRNLARNEFSGASKAHSAVHKAVALGQLPPAKTVLCADCDRPAQDYDHRDYGKPLDVQPVCRSCNLKRGPALWRERPAAATESAKA